MELTHGLSLDCRRGKDPRREQARMEMISGEADTILICHSDQLRILS
jgi:hypothetical protein